MKLSEDMKEIKPIIDDLMEQNDGWVLIKQILSENDDPARPLGMFLAQFVRQLGEMLAEQDLDVDVGVMLEEGGVVEYLLNVMEYHFDLPPEFSDEIFLDVVDIIQAQEQDPGAQEGGAPPPPQGGLAAQGPPPGEQPMAPPPQGAM